MCLPFLSQIYAALIHEGAAHPSACCEWGTWWMEGKEWCNCRPSACEHVLTSVNQGLSLGLGFKEAGERRHMWMHGAVPCQLQEIQGLLRGWACLLCKHVHVYMRMCFHINSGEVVPYCLVVELVGTCWTMNRRFSNLNAISLFHFYSLGRQMAEAHFGEIYL